MWSQRQSDSHHDARPGGLTDDEIRRYLRALERQAQRSIGRVDLARDLAQDVMAVYFVQTPQPVTPWAQDGPLPWLYGVLRNHIRMHYRSENRRQERERSWHDNDVSLAHVDPDEEILLRAIVTRIAELPPLYRDTVRLHFLQGWDTDEIAARENITAAAVRHRIRVGLDRVRASLDKSELDKSQRSKSSALWLWAFPKERSAPMLRSPRQLSNWVVIGAATMAMVAIWQSSRSKPERQHDAAGVTSKAETVKDVPVFRSTEYSEYAESTGATNTPFFDGPTCNRSLQMLIDQAPPGTVLHLPACVFREKVTLSKPLILDASGGAEIRGSDVWRDFQPEGDHWRSARTVPVPHFCDGFPEDWVPPNYSIPKAPFEDSIERIAVRMRTTPPGVYTDGRALKWVDRDPGAGQYTLDASRHVLLGDDPTIGTVEVAVRATWLAIASNNVVVRGFTMRHTWHSDCSAAIETEGRIRGAILENNWFTGASMRGITLMGTDHVLRHNQIDHVGGSGVVIHRGSENVTVHGNWIHHNGHVIEGQTMWGAGGIAIVDATLTLRGNAIEKNGGSGVFVIGSAQTSIHENLIGDNSGFGVAFSAGTHNNKVSANYLLENGDADRSRPGQFAFTYAGANRIEENHYTGSQLQHHLYGSNSSNDIWANTRVLTGDTATLSSGFDAVRSATRRR